MALEELFKNVTKRFNDDTPDEPTFKCPRCQQAVPESRFQERNKVCPNCNYHARLTANERLRLTVDKGSFVEYDADMHSVDPLTFPGYANKVESLQTITGLKDAVITGECTIKGSRTVLIVMDSHFMMASMGSVVGEKLTRLFEYATENHLPVIIFTASGGARMQEGMFSLIQMAKVSGAAKRHSDAGGLYITVLTDPTTGGVTASFASLGDIILAEPGATVGFAGRRVIEGTIGEKLPQTFQTSEFLEEHGFCDMIVQRNMMRPTLAKLLRLHQIPAEKKNIFGKVIGRG
jgi:acetyl-CoA carboxylase carboxyl transferase subunit beta